MLLVVPGKESLTEDSCILDGAKPFRELRAIFQGLELGFRIRIVIAHMGSAVGFGDPKICKEMSHCL